MRGPPGRRGTSSDQDGALAVAQASFPLATRALGSLYLAGGLIGLVSLVLPHSAHSDQVGLYSNVAIALIGGSALLLLGQRLPHWSVHVSLVAGAVLITRALWLSGDPVSFYSVWFIWVGLYAFYFMSRPAAAAHVAVVAVLYAVTLAHMHTSMPVARWLTTVATLVVAGMFIDTLVRRARREAGAAAANANRMTRLAELAHELAGLSEASAARPAVCATAAHVTGARAVALWEPADDGTCMMLTASWGDEPTRTEIPFAGPPAGVTQAFTSGQLTVAQIGEAGSLCVELPGDPPRAGSCLWQPISRDHVPVAVLSAYWDDQEAADNAGQRVLADLLAAEVAVTLERVELLDRLELVARTDELTGLPNRRAWQEVLPRELARCRRDTEPLCVAMLDLDHFKEFNDRRGHQAGDRLLKQVAGSWNAQLRGSDVLARYGGEEFALLLPGCKIEQAQAIVERLREVIPVEQTCSAGIACLGDRENAGELIERADRALYEAKRGGRNQAVLAADPVSPEAGLQPTDRT